MKNRISLLLLLPFAFAACKKEDAKPQTWNDVKTISINYVRSSFGDMPINTYLTLSFLSPAQEDSVTFLNTSNVDVHRLFNTGVTLQKDDFFYLKVLQSDCTDISPCPGTISEIYVPETFGEDLETEWKIGMLDNSVAFLGVSYNY